MLPFPMSSILTLVSPAESATGSPLLSWGPLHSCGRGRNRYIAASQAYPQSRANVTMDCAIATSLFLTTSIQPLYFQVHTVFRSGAPLSAVHSITCALFLSARGVSPSGIPIQDFSASVSPCLCGKSHVLSNLQPLVPLFALFSALPSFVFNRLQPLFPKHPGWGVPRPLDQHALRSPKRPSAIRNVDAARTSNYHCCKLKVPGPWMKPQN